MSREEERRRRKSSTSSVKLKGTFLQSTEDNEYRMDNIFIREGLQVEKKVRKFPHFFYFEPFPYYHFYYCYYYTMHFITLHNISEVDPKKLMEETIKKHEAFQFLVKKRATNTERKMSRFESLSFSDNPQVAPSLTGPGLP